MEATRQSQISSLRQQRTRACIVCGKKSVGRKIKTAGNFNQDAECCCVTCKQILTCTVSAFVQGFAISWAMSSFSRRSDSEKKLGVIVACGHVSDKQVSNDTERKRAELKLESVENSSSLNVSNGTVKNGERFVRDSDDMSPPVHFVSVPVEGEKLSHESFSDSPSALEDSDSVNESSHELCSLQVSESPQNNESSQTGILKMMSSNVSGTESNSLGSEKSNSPVSSISQLRSKRVSLQNRKTKARVKAEKEKGLLSLSGVSNRMRSKKASSKRSSGVANQSKLPSKHKAPKYHSCAFCSKTFTIKRKLHVHVRTHSTGKGSFGIEANQKNFACEFCANFYTSKESLRAHIKCKHSGEPEVECDVCGSIQPSSFALSAHKKACHDFNKLCYVCGAVFTSKPSFDKHMASHFGVKRYFCDICDTGFVHKSSLYHHKTVHVSTKSFQCDVCSQMFKMQHLLNRHLLHSHQCGPSLEHRVRGLKKMGVDVDKDAIIRHANNQCVVCGQGLLEGKCASHPENSQQVFECPTCGGVKDHIVLFYQHVKWHKGTLQFNKRCRYASIGLPLPVSEGSATGYNCAVCFKTFKSSNHLNAHMHQHREARFSCEICSKQFIYKCNLKKHMNSHLDTCPFECEVCKKKFKDKHLYQSHQSKHKEPQFKCDICGKALTRRPYLLKHIETMHPEHQQSS
ncbi:zinc finger protein 431-like [Littorina saxatilis]|uniref:C2H2-type domain-containing protein n=1 Tax=Littorina saxatilis TaxID=31220 RepID=A0AAN9BZS1_9CAEN